MELSEALPLLTENHTAVASTVTPKGRVQSTIVTTGMVVVAGEVTVHNDAARDALRHRRSGAGPRRPNARCPQ